MTHALVRQPALVAVVAALLAAACGRGSGDADTTSTLPASMRAPRTTNADATPPAIPYDSATPRVAFRPTHAWPHDTAAFTEGLLLHDGRLLESTGLKGHSDLREVVESTGTVQRRITLAPSVFGEGIAVVGSRLYQLTWQEGRGFVYDAATLAPVDSFAFTGEGWGLTSDGTRIYMSDGSSHVRVITPDGFRTERTFQVTEAGQPVWMINELEWVRGELWANVYQTNLIARIDPLTGAVRGYIDLASLLTSAERSAAEAHGGVANGIAADSASGRVLVTGKLWPHLFEGRIDAIVGAHATSAAPR